MHAESGVKPRLLLAGAALLALHLILGLRAARELSATFDEPMHVAAGAALWLKGDARMDANNPPLAKLFVSAPAVALGIRPPFSGQDWAGAFHYAFGERAMFWNGQDGGRFLFAARAANLLLSLLLIAALWRLVAARRGEGAGLAVAAVAALSPSVLAHASLATNDLAAAAFAVLGVLACAEFAESGRADAALAAGLLAAAGALCKWSAVLVWPVYAALLWGAPPARRRLFLLRAALPFAGVALVFAAAFPELARGLFVRVGQVTSGVHPVFVLGENRPSGRLDAYALILLAKSTFLELGVLAAGLWSLRRSKTPFDRAPLLLALVYFAAASLSAKQIGLRYMLPLYFALALEAGRLVSLLPERRGLAAAGAALLLQGAPTLACAPDFIPYFNAAARGPARALRLLGDSNLDWGQDLGRLAAWVRANGSPSVYLSYFGTDAPERFGLIVEHVGSHNAVRTDRKNPPGGRAVLAVSATNLQETYGRGFGWLRERAPLARAGESILVYEADAALLARLKKESPRP